MMKISACMLAILLCFFLVPCSRAEHRDYSAEELLHTMREIIAWKADESASGGSAILFHEEFLRGAGSSAADWYALAVGRMGYSEEYADYLAVLKNEVARRYETDEKLGDKATEWHRIALTVLALGADPTDFGQDARGERIDLIRDGIFDRVQALGAQGVNGCIWGLIALDAMRYALPGDDGFEIRRTILSEILKNQLPDGSFTLDGSAPDVDITAMALQALSPYYSSQEGYSVPDGAGGEKTVTPGEAADAAIAWLSSEQNGDGGFSSWGEDNLESCAQVMTALCSLGIDPVNDSRFIKGENSLLDGLMQYRRADGGFAHSLQNTDAAEKSNSMSGQQALCALTALYRFHAGLRGLYDFRPEAAGGQAESSYGGKGTIVDIESCENVSPRLLFNEGDVYAYEALPRALTTRDYVTVVRLLGKLEEAENASDFAQLHRDLSAKKQELEALRNEIEAINQQISDRLYPFEALTRDDRDLAETLLRRVEKLSEYDRRQVLGYEDLLRIRTQSEVWNRAFWIGGGAAVLTLLLAAVLIVRIRARRRRKREQDFPLSQNVGEQDW